MDNKVNLVKIDSEPTNIFTFSFPNIGHSQFHTNPEGKSGTWKCYYKNFNYFKPAGKIKAKMLIFTLKHITFCYNCLGCPDSVIVSPISPHLAPTFFPGKKRNEIKERRERGKKDIAGTYD